MSTLTRSTILAACLCAAMPALAAMPTIAGPRVTGPAVISEGGVGPYYRLVSPASEPGFPPGVPDARESVCVSLGYQIKPDGSTSDYSLLKSWTSRHSRGIPEGEAYTMFSRSAVAAVMQRKFAPAEGGSAGAAPIFTATTFVFSADPAADRDALRAHCAIADLPDFIRRAQEDSYRRRGNLNKHRVDRYQMENPPILKGPGG